MIDKAPAPKYEHSAPKAKGPDLMWLLGKGIEVRLRMKRLHENTGMRMRPTDEDEDED